ncbi:M20/M25/M40 family metallo-hydrolase [Aminicella lysinilytica]|uniref:M20/M25/M40 family metallo-hydrolase n=1 Tax=Aminicella lysinilytica TaxID=433323 RepID=UPI0026E974F6|nr:M20/M25/M40 family metallo-hydrolase [Aminicella lysinilytica]
MEVNNIYHRLTTRGLCFISLNDQEATKYAEDVIGRDMPDNKLIKLETAVMGAEDFAYYSCKIPSSFIFIGSRNAEKGFVNLAHQPRFDIDEDAINIGIEVFCSLIFDIQI